MAYLKKERFTSLKMEKSSPVKQSTRKWENLPVDIISKIFNGVPFSDLCDNLPFVCHSWRLGCWHTISPNLHAPEGVDGSKKLMRLLKSIIWEGTDGYDTSLEQWKSSVHRIDIPDGVNISDEHLLYVAERTVGLKDLFIWNCSTMTGEGFAKAMCNWKNVKCLYLQKVRFQYVPQCIEEISKNLSPINKLQVWTPRSGLMHDVVRAIIEHIVNDAKMVELEHCFVSGNGFIFAFRSKSSRENPRLSLSGGRPLNIPDSLQSSLLFNITLNFKE
ncbi:hypothetical protein JRO89_XS15G0130800 [Xanthoceras sorbifolium]|uniref:F-box domain-containing protein n=1 Tax=Xanthoceras sorbifolium TaxID=99658 RepID=A0ABQ8H1Y6_9ROSI|nr:hypothetical protein JRO89_XS15G0130800 [Xanthoceras sorbifolium]